MINNKQEVIKELERLHEWFRNQDVDCKFKDEELYLNTLNLLREYLLNPISLADFLGWKEKEIYQKGDYQYQVRNNKLYRTSLEIEDWRIMVDANVFVALQTANKLESKFYLHYPMLEESRSYLNYNKDAGNFVFSTYTTIKPYQTIFTEADVKKLEKKYNIDLSYLKRIPVRN